MRQTSWKFHSTVVSYWNPLINLREGAHRVWATFWKFATGYQRVLATTGEIPEGVGNFQKMNKYFKGGGQYPLFILWNNYQRVVENLWKYFQKGLTSDHTKWNLSSIPLKNLIFKIKIHEVPNTNKQCCGSGSESGFVRICIIFQDPDPFPGCLGSGSLSVSYSNGTTKLTGRENLTKNTFCVGPVRPTDKEN